MIESKLLRRTCGKFVLAAAPSSGLQMTLTNLVYWPIFGNAGITLIACWLHCTRA
jgi:hypothetical protein